MSIIEKAAKRLASATAKVDAPEMRKIKTKDRYTTRTSYANSFEVLKKSAHGERLKALRILGTEEQFRKTADEYRRIKRPLLRNAFGKTASTVEGGALVAVTSAVQGEGKTYTTTNLALSVARERNRTVLLVDTDSIRAQLSSTFGVENKPGLTDLLTDDSLGIEDVIVRIEDLGFSIIPAGHQHDDASELLSSEKMQAIAKELTQRYSDRLIIFDAPPLLMTSEAQVIAGLVGQIIVVVSAVETPKNVVTEAIELLDADKSISFVLNKSNRSLGINQYGGYYGYR